MPLFEFKCGDCGAVQECLVNSGEEQTDLSCLSCGSPKLTKLMSSFAVKSGTSKSAKQGRCAICEEADGSTRVVPAIHINIDPETGSPSVGLGLLEVQEVRMPEPKDRSKLH